MSDITQVAEPTKKRLIELPERVWEALDKDAKRSRRSSMKKLQVLVENVYQLADTEMHDLQHVREALGHSHIPGGGPLQQASVRTGRPAAQLTSALASDGTNAPPNKRDSKKQELDIEDVRNDARLRTKQKREPGP